MPNWILVANLISWHSSTGILATFFTFLVLARLCSALKRSTHYMPHIFFTYLLHFKGFYLSSNDPLKVHPCLHALFFSLEDHNNFLFPKLFFLPVCSKWYKCQSILLTLFGLLTHRNNFFCISLFMPQILPSRGFTNGSVDTSHIRCNHKCRHCIRIPCQLTPDVSILRIHLRSDLPNSFIRIIFFHKNSRNSVENQRFLYPIFPGPGSNRSLSSDLEKRFCTDFGNRIGFFPFSTLFTP